MLIFVVASYIMSPDHYILSEELFFSLVDHIAKMAMGIERMIGIYTHPETEELCGIGLQYRNNRYQEYELDISLHENHIENLRFENSGYRWLDKNQVPFGTSVPSKSQLSIFDEYKHLILLVTLPGKHKRKDFVMIYFRDDVGSFGVQHQKSALSTDNKSIIGHMLSASIHSYCMQFGKMTAQFRQFTRKTQRILSAQRSENKEARRKKELEELVLSWANGYLKKCSEQEGVNYVYSDAATEKIKNYTGEFGPLEKAIKEAVLFAKEIFTDVNVMIEAEYIEIITSVTQKHDLPGTQGFSNLSNKLQRIYEYLDRIESASIKVDNEGKNITGVNVGNALERPITASAISDYVSKNRDDINSLFAIFPDRWSYVKNNFKSIMNIIPYAGSSRKHRQR